MYKNIVIVGFDPRSQTGLGRIGALIWATFIGLGTLSTLTFITIREHAGPTIRQKYGEIDTYIMPMVGEETILSLLHKANVKPDLIITIGDLWNFLPVVEYINQRVCPWIAYVGSEGTTYPQFASIEDNKRINIHDMFEYISAIWAYTSETEKVFKPIFDHPIHVFPHAIPYQVIRNAPAFGLRKVLGLPELSTIMGFVGDNLRRKGIDLFLKYFSKSNYDYAYIHAPDFRPVAGFDLGQMIYDYGLIDRVYIQKDLLKLRGGQPLSAEEVFGLYKDFNLFFHPHRAEGFGLCVMEALASGISVLASDCGGPSTFLPKKSKIPIKHQRYEQHGGVGYMCSEPDLDAIGDKKPENNWTCEGYSPLDFCGNLVKLLQIEYESRMGYILK